MPSSLTTTAPPRGGGGSARGGWLREVRVSGQREAAAAGSLTPTFYVVTPCLNAAATIGGTLLSVVTRTGDIRLRYHVQDTGSTDGTVAYLERHPKLRRTNTNPLLRYLTAGVLDERCGAGEAVANP